MKRKHSLVGQLRRHVYEPIRKEKEKSAVHHVRTEKK
jgi:hypothetical protein